MTFKKWISFLFGVSCLVLLEQLAIYKITDNFKIEKIRPPISTIPKEKIYPKEKTSNILKQKFNYLAKGHHAYAFLSEDQKYVLKFPRHHKFKTPFWFKICPIKKQKMENKKKRIDFLINSHLLAYKNLKKETGIIFLHLAKTNYLNQKLTLYDKIGRRQEIDPNDFDFVLQKNFILFKNLIPKAVKNQDKETLRKLIRAYFEVIASRTDKLIMNKDRKGWGNNYGTIDEARCFELDLGAYIEYQDLKNKEDRAWEIDQCSRDFRAWIRKNCPEELDFFEKEIKKTSAKSH